MTCSSSAAGPAGLSRAFWHLREFPDAAAARARGRPATSAAGPAPRSSTATSSSCGPQGFRPDDDVDDLAARGQPAGARHPVLCPVHCGGSSCASGRVHELPSRPGALLRSRLLSLFAKLRLLTEPRVRSRSPDGRVGRGVRHPPVRARGRAAGRGDDARHLRRRRARARSRRDAAGRSRTRTRTRQRAARSRRDANGASDATAAARRPTDRPCARSPAACRRASTASTATLGDRIETDAEVHEIGAPRRRRHLRRAGARSRRHRGARGLRGDSTGGRSRHRCDRWTVSSAICWPRSRRCRSPASTSASRARGRARQRRRLRRARAAGRTRSGAGSDLHVARIPPPGAAGPRAVPRHVGRVCVPGRSRPRRRRAGRAGEQTPAATAADPRRAGLPPRVTARARRSPSTFTATVRASRPSPRGSARTSASVCAAPATARSRSSASGQRRGARREVRRAGSDRRLRLRRLCGGRTAARRGPHRLRRAARRLAAARRRANRSRSTCSPPTSAASPSDSTPWSGRWLRRRARPATRPLPTSTHRAAC